ncbi:MAG: hypothetical protein M0Q21_06885 [Ignavibacteriaceae bacterium]|nr:hypothetical protein [Ignavibacteriaceae bacterium]
MLLNGKPPYQNVKEPVPNSRVWRYMDLAKFIQLISHSKLFFVRLDRLSDQLEGTLTLNNISEIQDRYENLDFPMSKKEATQRRVREVNDIENFRKYTLVNCWTKNVEESFALWKLYLGNQPYGISIQSKYSKLKSSIIDNNFSFLFQKVYYSNIVKDIKQSSVPFRKNKYYRFENEVRISVFNQYVKFGGEPKYERGTDVDVDIKRMIEKIYVSPYSPDWFFDLVNYLVNEKYKYDFPIIRSNIKEKY